MAYGLPPRRLPGSGPTFGGGMPVGKPIATLPGQGGAGPGFGTPPTLIGTRPGDGALLMKRGGRVPGKGTKDTVKAKLTPGEFVVNKRAAARNLPALTRMNKGGLVKHGHSAKDLARGYRSLG